MSISKIYTAGLNNAGSYQVSGIPYAKGGMNATATATAISVNFPYVTRWVTIVNNDTTNDLKVGFSSNGLAASDYFTVPRADTNGRQTSHLPRLELKLTELYFTGSTNFDVVAGLTNLPTQRVDNIGPVGSNWSGSVGVG